MNTNKKNFILIELTGNDHSGIMAAVAIPW